MDDEGRPSRRAFIAGGIAVASLAAPLRALGQVRTDPPDTVDPPDTRIVNQLRALRQQLGQIGEHLARIDDQLLDPPDVRVQRELTQLKVAAEDIATFAEDMLLRRR